MEVPDPLRAEAERRLWRYVIEVVERFALCPWARRARERGEIRVEVLLDTTHAALAAAVSRIADDPSAVMGMVVLPVASLDAPTLRRHRDVLLASRTGAAVAVGIADFHPDAPLDLSSAARLIPWLRRSPDPTLQVVRLDALAAARQVPPPPALAAQAQILAGHAAPPAPSPSAQIADDNLHTARTQLDDLTAALAAVRGT